MSNIQAIIFDFDGTIIDTELPDFQSWQEAFAAFGCELSFEVWSECIGKSIGSFDIYGLLDEMVGYPVDREQVRSTRRPRFDELLATLPLRPGVKAYLENAERLSFPLGIASSSPRAWVDRHLTERGIAPYFSVITTADDVEHAKPDPAVFRLACAALGVAPAATIAIEDSPNGLLAASQAGLFTVVVPNEITARLDFGPADIVVDSLTNLPLEDLLQRACMR